MQHEEFVPIHMDDDAGRRAGNPGAFGMGNLQIAYLHALLLDYGKGGNKPWDPMAAIRDYIVQVDPESPDLLLGKAYIALGPLRVHTNYFILERHRRGLTDYERRSS